MKQTLTLAFVLVAAPIVAQPVIKNTSGSWSHGASVTVNGINFGTKTVAVQKIWDRGEGTSVGTLWDDWEPTRATDPTCNIAYRTPIRGVTLPHNTSNTKYLAACHYGVNTSDGGNIIQVSDSRTVPGYPYYSYWSYYWREDPAWSNLAGENTDGNNKIHAISTSEGLLVNRFWYTEYATRPTSPSVIPNIDLSDSGGLGYRCRTAIVGACHSNGSGIVGYGPSSNNPINGWIKTEILLKWDRTTAGYALIYENGVKKYHTTGETDTDTSTLSRWEGIGLYSRARGITTWRYFDDIYFDTGVDAIAHVEICPGPTFATRGVCQTQPLTAWSSSSISFTMNRGALPSTGTAFVYVTDRDRNTNSTGFKVALNGSEGAPAPMSRQIILGDLSFFSLALAVAGVFMMTRRRNHPGAARR